MKIDCPECHGAAVITLRHWSSDPQLEVEVSCSRCLGMGWIEEEEDDDSDDNE